MKLYPLTFKPIYKEKIWGGQRLSTILGRNLPPGRRIGESWEIADHRDDVSCVSEGPLSGVTLRELMREKPKDLLGAALADRDFARFPLLVKLIDASDRLSVQVHPADEYAHAHEKGEEGKTEMWYVVHCDAGAELVCGLKEGVNREDFEDALHRGVLGECLRSIRVEKGDVFFIPAGRTHAIGAGNLILEIQENSDVTYRVYDWNRLGSDGKPRQLHIGKAMQVIDFDDRVDARVSKRWVERDGYRRAPLVTCRHFSTEQIKVESEWNAACSGDRFRIISVVEGGGKFYYENGQNYLNLSGGENVLLPASLGAYRLAVTDRPCILLQTEVP
jgi:mannose-6-phosphate isomerase